MINLLGEQNNKSPPEKHTEEVSKVVTIEDDIVLSSDSDVDPKKVAEGSKKGNGHRINKSKEEIKCEFVKKQIFFFKVFGVFLNILNGCYKNYDLRPKSTLCVRFE